MFKLPYLYYYCFAWLLIVCLQRVAGRGRSDVGRVMNTPFAQIVLAICTTALISFFVLGFWFMPKWWYPLAFAGCSLIVSSFPIPDKVGAALALVAAPILIVLAYLSMFNVI